LKVESLESPSSRKSEAGIRKYWSTL